MSQRSDTRRDAPSSGLLSIGALAQSSGVPVATIRNWERRYGFPEAERLPSGHRRYPAAVVPQLERVRRLMDRGVRPADAVRAVREGGDLGEAPPTEAPRDADESWTEAVIHRGLRLDANGLDQVLDSAWRDLGPLDFLQQVAGPMLFELGERWARGEISVATEHFVSERMRDLLTTRRRSLSRPQGAPRVVCACLPGERHVLGLHIAATAVAHGGAQDVFLGSDTPIRDVLAAVDRVSASAVVVSSALGASEELLEHQLKVLRRGLPREVGLWVGGAGAAHVALPARTERIGGLHDLHARAMGLS